MIVLYTMMLSVLAVLKRLTNWRATRLERKYARTARQADGLAREPLYRGNSNRPDVAQSARRQYLLGQLVEKRERLEGKYVAWKGRAERVGKWQARLQGWQGKKLPYTFGVVDVALLLSLIDTLGVGRYVSVQSAWHVLSTWLNR